jgi:hypothetical protein
MNIEQFNEAIDALWTRTKAGLLPREARFKAIEEMTDKYIEASGKLPDTAQLDRLATLCLYEEVTDDTPYRIANTEYPIMGDRMFEERSARNVPINARDKEHERKSAGNRRQRSQYENANIDRTVRSENRARRKKHNDFINGKTAGVMRVVIKET